MPQAPENPILIGGQSFWFYFGNITVTTGGQPDARNCMVVCRSVDCGTKLSVEDVEMFKALDTAIEGSTDAKAGQVRAISTAGTSTFHTVAATATTVSRANGSVGLDLATDVEATSSTWSTSHYGAVWTFDKPY